MEFVTNNPNNILTGDNKGKPVYTSTGFEISDEAAMLAKCQNGKQTAYNWEISNRINRKKLGCEKLL